MLYPLSYEGGAGAFLGAKLSGVLLFGWGWAGLRMLQACFGVFEAGCWC